MTKPAVSKKSAREEMLLEVARIISGQRDEQYGGPEDNFEKIARIWTVLFDRKFSREDIAMAMVGVKMARYAAGAGFQPDTWTDIAGYAACGYEVGIKENSLLM
jgi:hypothetical protein